MLLLALAAATSPVIFLCTTYDNLSLLISTLVFNDHIALHLFILSLITAAMTLLHDIDLLIATFIASPDRSNRMTNATSRLFVKLGLLFWKVARLLIIRININISFRTLRMLLCIRLRMVTNANVLVNNT